MISTVTTCTSAVVLFIAGVVMLFAPDVLLPRLMPGFPPAGAWVGQLLGAAWLGVAVLNWLQRAVLLGGIYGRPVVLANLMLYSVSALSLIRALQEAAVPQRLWFVAVPAALMALVYGALLLRGPFDALPGDPAR